ncbi:MAG TPA: carboxypeptidase regulatory-like domain-containing protein [bacterium]|jgi:hypothetical protein
MRRLVKVWVWALALLTLAGAVVVMGATGSRSVTHQTETGRPVNPALSEAFARMQEKVHRGIPLNDQDKQLTAEMMAATSGRESRRPLDNQGGPDAFGYMFVDNQGGDTATYSWIELRGDDNATWLNAADFTSVDDGMTNAPVEIGFNFPFYGQTYSQCSFGTNGDVQFATSYAYEYTQCLPRMQSGAMVTAFATDLHLLNGGIPTGDGVVGYKNFGTYFVVEWDSVGFYNTGICPNGSLKFQAILYNSGRIKFQYNQLIVPTGCFGTYAPNIGIQQNGTTGTSLVYACGQAGIFPVDGQATWFVLPNGVPRPVTNLQSAVNGHDVTLTWVDPTQDTNGNPMAVDSVQIWMGAPGQGTRVGVVSPGVQTFVHSNAPDGNLVYYVRAANEGWFSPSVTANAMVGTPTYSQDFEIDNGAWVADNGWAWGTPTFAQAPAPHSGTNVWGTVLDGPVPANACYHLDLDLGLEVISPAATLEFWGWWSMYPANGYDACHFEVSVDGGTTWELITPVDGYTGMIWNNQTCIPNQNAWSNTSNGWRHIVLPIGAYLGQTPMYRFTFGSVSWSSTYAGFYIDDMMIWGLHPAQQANIAGTITLNGGTGNVTQALVATDGLGSPTAHPAANGTYTLTNAQVGHRRIVASLAGYVPDTLLVLLDSTGYTGANITLRRVAPPAPTGLTGTVRTTARIDSLHWDVSPDVLVDGYKLYRRPDGTPTWQYRRTVTGRATQWVLDTLETEGVYQYVITAIDNDVTDPPVESDYSNTITKAFGHQPPALLTANGNFDNRIHLSWVAPGAPLEREVYYDNGVNSPAVFDIRWLGQVSFGYFVSHFQTNNGPATITRIKIYYTHNATLGDPIEVAVFADTGDGTPTFTPLGLISTQQEEPFDSFRTFIVDPPVTIPSGSFFVGTRQVTANGICIGGDQVDPMINNTFFCAPDVFSWYTFEWEGLMAIPMIRALVVGDIGDGLASETELAPSPSRITAPVPAFLAHPSKTMQALSGSVPGKKSMTQPAVALCGAPGYRGMQMGDMADRRRTSLPYRAPYMEAAGSVNPGRHGHSLDDVVRFVIYRDNAVRDSVGPNVTQYDDATPPLQENVPHTYWVKARWDDNALSVNSDTVTARCNMAPGAPTNVTVTPVGLSQMHVTWTDPTINADGTPCTDLDSLRVYRDGTYIGHVLHGVQTYTDTPPDPMMIYSWTVKAIDEVPNEGAGASASGSVVSPWHTVELQWVDITTNGTVAAQSDDIVTGPYDLGFNFPYYGQTYTSVMVGSNGYITFGDQTVTLGAPCPPNVGVPNGVVFAFAADLWPTAGQCKYYADAANQRFIVSWDHCPPCCSDNSPYRTFQIILDSNGGVTLQYGQMDNNSGVVGLENADGSDGVSLWCNNTGPFTPGNNAVQFWGGPRQAIDGTIRHLGGSNPFLENAHVWVTGLPDTMLTDANGHYQMPVDPGTYTVHFQHATHCDSVRANVVVEPNVNSTINMSLRSPNATLSASSLTFVVRRFQTVPQSFTITNTAGNCPLSYEVLDSVAWLTSDPASGTVNPNETTTITVTAAPGTLQPNEYHTTMRVLCNAPGSPFLLQVDMNVLSVDQIPGLLPTEFALHANYPNPFNPTTLLPFDVPQNSQVAIIVYNVMGQEVATLVNGKYAAGRYQVSFDAGNLPSGLYLVKMTAGNYTAMNKMMMLK